VGELIGKIAKAKKSGGMAQVIETLEGSDFKLQFCKKKPQKTPQTLNLLFIYTTFCLSIHLLTDT
jgi:hypothetical protein